jgi:DNA-binding beta-propeller fold protein YncE
VAVDPKSGHGFVSSNPVVMFDTTTLQPIKSIQTEGSPDGLFYEPFKQQIYILSHGAPNVTVINASDGSIAGTIDLGGAPEEGQSDGLGHAYIDVESGDNVAVVDCATLAVTGHYDISASGTGPAGLSVDAKNRIIFSYCRTPNVCVILNADTGKVVTTLPIGVGCDAAEFNPDTLEAFSSQGDGTLTIIKENSPTDFAVEQTVKTKTGAKCSTLDLKTGHIILTTADYAAPATRPAGQAAGGGGPGGPGAGPGGGGPGGPGGAAGGGAGRRGGRGGRGRGQIVAGSFQLIEVGKE